MTRPRSETITIEDIRWSSYKDPELESRLSASEVSHEPSLVIRTISDLGDRSLIDLSLVNRTEVARAIGCSPHAVQRALSGDSKSLPSLPLAFELAKVLRTTVDSLYQAITGSNGTNPGRYIGKGRFIGSFTPGSHSWNKTQPKYVVNGKGFDTLSCALRELGVQYKGHTGYDQLPESIKSQIKRNVVDRG